MLARSTVVSSALAALALGSTPAVCQQLRSEQSTVLTALVSEQATVSLVARAADLRSAGGRVAPGTVVIDSWLAESDARSLCVRWSWVSLAEPQRSFVLTSRAATLPLRDTVTLGSGTLLTSLGSVPRPVTILVKIESFEF